MNRVWAAISGGSNYDFSLKDRMEIWLAEHWMRAERLVMARLTFATWVLVLVTVLASATRTKPPRRGCSLRRWGLPSVSSSGFGPSSSWVWRADYVS